MTGKVLSRELAIPSDTVYLKDFRAFLKAILEEAGLLEREAYLIVLALDEALSVVLENARDNQSIREIRIRIQIDDVGFKATVEDSEQCFDPSHLSESDLLEYLDKERRYTLGIFLMREIMDEVNYTYRKGFQNELQLVKFISRS